MPLSEALRFAIKFTSFKLEPIFIDYAYQIQSYANKLTHLHIFNMISIYITFRILLLPAIIKK